MKTAVILDTKQQIDLFHFTVLVSALKLEIFGLKRRGQSAYSILKNNYGLKGSRETVLKQAQEMLRQAKGTPVN